MIAFRSPLARFLALYGALYAAFGVQSPYLPSLLDSHGLPPEAIALVLAAGTAIRLVAGPAAGRLADRRDAPKAVFIACSAAAGLIALGYLPAGGLWPLLIVGVIHSAALAPLAPLSDTLALSSAAPARQNDPFARGLYYGWLRGAGSAAFILGTVLSSQAIGRFGIVAVVWLNAGLFAAAAFAARIVPILLPAPNAAQPAMAKTMVQGLGALLRLPLYRRIVLTPAPVALPSVIGGPGSDFTVSVFLRAPVGYRIDTANQRLGLKGELRRQIALTRYRAGPCAIFDGFSDKCHRGASVPVRFEGDAVAVCQPVLQQ